MVLERKLSIKLQALKKNIARYNAHGRVPMVLLVIVCSSFSVHFVHAKLASVIGGTELKERERERE